MNNSTDVALMKLRSTDENLETITQLLEVTARDLEITVDSLGNSKLADSLQLKVRDVMGLIREVDIIKEDCISVCNLIDRE